LEGFSVNPQLLLNASLQTVLPIFLTGERPPGPRDYPLMRQPREIYLQDLPPDPGIMLEFLEAETMLPAQDDQDAVPDP